ncbi:MAG: hypothetical protein IJM75_04825 [Ruminococcus sp.]|nr:hypothetical protein [Ruminococcus sp.]
MSIDLNKLGSLLGLEISAKEHKLYGSRGGFNMSIRYFSNDLTFMVRIYAAVLDKSVRGALTEFGRSRKGYTFIRAWDNRVTAMLTIDRRDTEEAVAGEINAFLELVSSLGFYPCCSMCGENKPVKMYSLLFDDCNTCDDCTAVLRYDVDKSNTLLSSQRSSLLRALPGCLIAALLSFLYAFWSAGAIPAVWNGALDSGTGVILSVFFIKKFTASKTSAATAVMSVLICIVAAWAGTVMWFCDYFADFNRDNAESQQVIVTYYEEVQRGNDPYATAYHGGDVDIAMQYAYLDDMSQKDLDKSYTAAKRIIDNQTTTDCLLHFPDLMFSQYGEKMVDGFYKLIIGNIVGAVIIGALLWRRVLSMDKLRYKLVPLPMNTVNPYDMFMGGNNGRQ